MTQMFLPKYQRFVAWRYLLERHRHLSGSVAAVVQASFCIALGLGAACLWFPLSDNTKVPPPNPPAVMIDLIGLVVVLPLVGLLAALVKRARGASASDWLWCSAYWGLVALAAFALYRRGIVHEGWSSTELFVGIGLCALAALANPIIFGVVNAWRGGHNPSSFSVALALLLVPLPLPLWVVGKIRRGSAGPSRALIFALAMAGVALATLTLAGAYLGFKSFAWPVLFEGSSMGKLAGFALAFLALGVLAGAVALVAVLRKRRAAPALEWSALGFSLGLALLAAALFYHGVQEVGENLEFIGGWSKYTPPMGLIIPAIVMGALSILAMVLLGVRYLFTFFTTVSIGGVTIGTMALVIVLSVMSGFENDLREKILGFNAHIQISKTDEIQFGDYRKVEKVLGELDGVLGFTPFLITEAYMSNHNNYGNVTLKGIDPARVASVTDIVHNLEKGDERALEKIWPLGEDGSILGAPAPREPLPDVGDDDDDDGPTDFSGGLDEVGDGEEAGEGASGDTAEAAKADADDELAELDLGPPIDFSGGLESYEDPDAGVVADAGADDTDPAQVDFDAFDELVGEDELETLDEDWDAQEVPHDYIGPDIAVLDGVLVGRELVNQIHLFTDQEVRVISPLPDVSPDGLSIPRMKNFRVAGRFFSGMYEYDLKYVYCSLSSLQDFLDLGDVVNGIEVRVRDPRSTGVIVKQLENALGPEFHVQDWKELNKALFSALKLEKIAMFFVLVIIVLVASFSIIGNLIMVVIEKAKEIAILKTLGSSDSGVMKIFVTQGFFIGLVGTSLGVALGLGACYLGKTFGVPLDPDVYYIDKLPIQVEFASVAAVGLAGLLISVVATLYPAYVAAKMRPVKGLRWDS